MPRAQVGVRPLGCRRCLAGCGELADTVGDFDVVDVEAL